MKISQTAIKAVKENRRCINLLAVQMDVHSASVERWIKDNVADGDLTKLKAVEIISKETGLTQKQILIDQE